MDGPQVSNLSTPLLRAIHFAAGRHRDHRRKDSRQTPYVNHLIEVALLLSEVVGDSDPDLIIAGLLHDTVEDVGVTRDELEAQFGEGVAALVLAVTDDKNLLRAFSHFIYICYARYPQLRQ